MGFGGSTIPRFRCHHEWGGSIPALLLPSRMRWQYHPRLPIASELEHPATILIGRRQPVFLVLIVGRRLFDHFDTCQVQVRLELQI